MQLKTDLSKYNNSWYKINASLLKQSSWYLVNYVFFQSYFPFNTIKKTLLQLFGAKIGNNLIIKPSVNIKYPWMLSIGNNVWIGEKVWIDNLDEVVLGDNVCLSQGSMLLCGNHNYQKTTFDLITKPIVLEKGVWIGAKAVVCPGVTCKSHAVLTVASVATENLDEYSIYKGNPAIKIKSRVIAS